MSNYTKITNFAAKDALAHLDPNKIASGTSVDNEFNAISTAIATKADLTSPTLVTPNIGAATGTSLSVTGSLTSTIATGTAPLVVSSTTPVANLSIGGNAATATSIITYTSSTTPLPGTGGSISIAHGLGTQNFIAFIELTCLTAEWNYSIGDRTTGVYINYSAGFLSPPIWNNSTNVGLSLYNTSVFYIFEKPGGPGTQYQIATAANWSYRFILIR